MELDDPLRRRAMITGAIAIALALPVTSWAGAQWFAAVFGGDRPWPHCRGTVVDAGHRLRCEADPVASTTVPAAQALLLGRRMDLNRASADDLTLVPGIGTKLADRIVRSRDEHGPFRTLAAVRRVKGIGPKLLERISSYAEVRPGAATSARP